MNLNSERPSSIRTRIVWISVLMAFGLYLTRISMGEMVKSESFLTDPTLVNAPSTRFSVDLTKVQDESQVKQLIAELQQRSGQKESAANVKTPMTLRDNLTKQEADELLSRLEASGGEGFIRISKQQIGSILGGFFFTYALLQVPAGWFSDRMGARRVLTVYILFWSLLTGLTGLVSSLGGLLVARLAFGLAQAGAYPTSSSIVRRWFPLSERGHASALISFGGRLGGTAAPYLTIFLIWNAGGWRPTLLMYGIAGIAIAISYYLIVRNRPSEHSACNQAERDLIGTLPDDRRPETRHVLMMLKACCLSRSLWLNSLGQFCVNIGWAFLVTWLPTYLKEVQKVPEQQGALMLSIVLAMGMLGQLIGGSATDWSVRRFGLRIGRVLPITISSFIAGIAYLCCLGIDSVWGIIACCAVVSMMTDVANPSIWAFMQDVGGRNTGAIFGWANMWGNLGAAASSKVVPLLLVYGSNDGSGQSLVFVTCAVAFFVAGISALGMDATKPLRTATD
ncbi:MAG: MFS transporter [Pirellula sp.]